MELRKGDVNLSIDMERSQVKSAVDACEFGPQQKLAVDMLAVLDEFNHLVLRACIGTLLDLRCHFNFCTGAVFVCSDCNVRGTQSHFVDTCPRWATLRRSFLDSHRGVLSLVCSGQINVILTKPKEVQLSRHASKEWINQKSRLLGADLKAYIGSIFEEFFLIYSKEADCIAGHGTGIPSGPSMCVGPHRERRKKEEKA